MSTQDAWTGGYVAELPYTFGFYRELTPALLQFALGVKGVAMGALATKRFAYCELGSGQGVSSALLAAANPTAEFHATDFNPTHTAHARRLAAEAKLDNITFYDDSFAEFLERDLPEFDIISLHGVYSWISTGARQEIVDFIRRKLKVGGLVYISYNCLPGWTAGLALRELMVTHASGSAEALTTRIENAMAFANKLEATKAGYFVNNPAMKSRLDRIADMPRNYLAHEYFNRDWHPLYFKDVAAELDGAKLTYVCSAILTEHIDALNLTAEQQALLAEVPDPIAREVYRDYITNEQFRRDVFVKGPLQLSVTDQTEQLLGLRVALTSLPADIPRTATGKLGEAGLQADVYEPIIAALAGGPMTIRQLLERPEIAALGLARLGQALTILVGGRSIEPAMDLGPEIDDLRRRSVEAFNMVMLERSRTSADMIALASPVTTGGIPSDRFEMLFLLSQKLNKPDPAAFAYEVLAQQGQRVLRDGKLLESAEENLAELRERLKAFNNKRMPVLKQLGIV